MNRTPRELVQAKPGIHFEEGPGTELKGLLHRLGIKTGRNCRCNHHAIVMNQKGTKWCRENRQQVIDWMQEEAKKQGMPFSRGAASVLITVALWRSERNAKLRPDS